MFWLTDQVAIDHTDVSHVFGLLPGLTQALGIHSPALLAGQTRLSIPAPERIQRACFLWESKSPPQPTIPKSPVQKTGS